MLKQTRLTCTWVLSLLCGCASPVTTTEIPVTPDVETSLTRYRREYVLSPGDGIDIWVRGVPELSRPLTVRPDGYVSMPIAGEVEVGGHTAREVDDEITELVAERIRDPEVTVIATITRPAMVYVVGEVAQPTPVEHRLAATAAQAVAHAGGFLESANETDVSIIRLTEDGHLRAIRLGDVPSGQPGSFMSLQGLALLPDDIIFVPESGIAQWNYFINTYINQTLLGVNAILETWTNYRLIRVLERSL